MVEFICVLAGKLSNPVINDCGNTSRAVYAVIDDIEKLFRQKFPIKNGLVANDTHLLLVIALQRYSIDLCE